MSSFPDTNLYQTCVYWAAPINDGYGGFSWADPVELSCRWASSARVLPAPDGQQVLCGVAVQIDQDVDQNGYMLQGTLDDLESGEYNDPVEAGALPIVRFDKVPTVDGTRFYRVAFLSSVYRGVDL